MIIGWIFTIIALVGTFLNAQMNILGFVFWIVSNTGFLIINILNTNYAEAVLFFVNTKKKKKKKTKQNFNFKYLLSNSVMATRLVLVQKTPGSSPGWTTCARVGIGRQATLRW